jgi:hypothetical protein
MGRPIHFSLIEKANFPRRRRIIIFLNNSMVKRRKMRFVVMGEKRWEGVSQEERTEFASNNAKKLWRDIPPEERSRIMSERRRKGYARKYPERV